MKRELEVRLQHAAGEGLDSDEDENDSTNMGVPPCFDDDDLQSLGL